ncbi:MAG TPA: hypothetical protein VGK73_11405 [Polyangiaceae bacterium]
MLDQSYRDRHMPASHTPLSTGPAPMLRPRAPATPQQGMTRADFERKLSESVALETAVLACSERADETAMAGRRNVAELCRRPRATESSTLALPGGSSLSRVA